MKLSHSKLSTILNCPMTYYLSYIEKISLKDKKPALLIGSAVHWGIEHNTDDLSDFFNENGSFKIKDNYTKEQSLAESMTFGYLKHKDEIFNKLLTDPITNEKLKLEEEYHELYLTGKIKSKYEDIEYNDFVGIIDLLLLTNKGFVLIDYKTSTLEPDWTQYLDQIYRYIILLKTNFPDVPVCKIGIINIRKTGIRQKKNETDFQFQQRMKFEYELNDENYINYHEFPMSEIDKSKLKSYELNLEKMCDSAEMINRNKMWYINFNNAITQYGKSDFYDIFYKTENNYLLYQIEDYFYDSEEDEFKTIRDCKPIDMEVIEHDNCLNKYSKFKQAIQNWKELNNDISFKEYINNNYIVDEELLKLYSITLKKEESLI